MEALSIYFLKVILACGSKSGVTEGSIEIYGIRHSSMNYTGTDGGSRE